MSFLPVLDRFFRSCRPSFLRLQSLLLYHRSLVCGRCGEAPARPRVSFRPCCIDVGAAARIPPSCRASPEIPTTRRLFLPRSSPSTPAPAPVSTRKAGVSRGHACLPAHAAGSILGLPGSKTAVAGPAAAPVASAVMMLMSVRVMRGERGGESEGQRCRERPDRCHGQRGVKRASPSPSVVALPCGRRHSVLCPGDGGSCASMISPGACTSNPVPPHLQI